MSSILITFIVLAVVGGFLAARRLWPKRTRRWFNRIETVRVIAWSIIVVSVAFVFIASGAAGMALVGAVILGYGVLYVLEQDLLTTIRGVLP